MCDASLVSAAKSGDASAVRSILRHAASDAHRAALLDHRGEGTADATIGNTPAHWAASWPWFSHASSPVNWPTQEAGSNISKMEGK